tara:strand:- start:53 stop:283 length:231 start_codon:yes stop_codon:yes gene_type:complete
MIDSNISDATQEFNLSLQEAARIAHADPRTILKYASRSPGVARKIFGRWCVNEKQLRLLCLGVPAEDLGHLYDRAS